VANCRNVDAALFIENLINDSIITDANTPQAFLTGQFASSVWPWDDGKGLDLRKKDTANDGWIEDFQLAARRAGKIDAVFSHVACLGGGGAP